MPRIDRPARWVIKHLAMERSVFATRFNDGEMVCMYRTRPEGSLLGTVATPAYTSYAWGDALRGVLEGLAGPERDRTMIGCSWGTDRADDLCIPFGEDVARLGLEGANWCHEHWPLEGVVDGSTRLLIDYLRLWRKGRTVLVTCPTLQRARHCLGAEWVQAPEADSWQGRDQVDRLCRPFAEAGYVFAWAAGGGLKPLAWDLWRRYPGSTHIDLGHLFNGAAGLEDYGWLQRKDGPWYEPYRRVFAPYVRSFIP